MPVSSASSVGRALAIHQPRFICALDRAWSSAASLNQRMNSAASPDEPCLSISRESTAATPVRRTDTRTQRPVSALYVMDPADVFLLPKGFVKGVVGSLMVPGGSAGLAAPLMAGGGADVPPVTQLWVVISLRSPRPGLISAFSRPAWPGTVEAWRRRRCAGAQGLTSRLVFAVYALFPVWLRSSPAVIPSVRDEPCKAGPLGRVGGYLARLILVATTPKVTSCTLPSPRIVARRTGPGPLPFASDPNSGVLCVAAPARNCRCSAPLLEDQRDAAQALLRRPLLLGADLAWLPLTPGRIAHLPGRAALRARGTDERAQCVAIHPAAARLYWAARGTGRNASSGHATTPRKEHDEDPSFPSSAPVACIPWGWLPEPAPG